MATRHRTDFNILHETSMNPNGFRLCGDRVCISPRAHPTPKFAFWPSKIVVLLFPQFRRECTDVATADLGSPTEGMVAADPKLVQNRPDLGAKLVQNRHGLGSVGLNLHQRQQHQQQYQRQQQQKTTAATTQAATATATAIT